MVIPDKNKNLIIALASNIDVEEMVFVGGVTDFYHFSDMNIENNTSITDVDIRIKNASTLNKIENLLGVSANIVWKTDEYCQYYFYLPNKLILDVFLDNSVEYSTKKIKLFDLELYIESIECRMLTLKKTINKEIIDRSTNKIMLKYLRKYVLYKTKLDVS